MPDVNATIRFNSVGAEKVANDIQKIKAGFDDASESAKGMTASAGGGGDPFQRAMNQAASHNREEMQDTITRQTRNAQEMDRAQQREQSARSMSGASQGGRPPQTINQIAGAAQQAESGGLFGAAGGLLAAIPGLGLAAGAIIGGLNFLDKKAREEVSRRAQPLYGSGVGQRLAQANFSNYFQMRSNLIELERDSGLSSEQVQGFLGALSQSGGAGGANIYGLGMRAGTVFQQTGLDVGVQGALVGAATRLGFDQNAVIGDTMLGRAMGAYGRADTGHYMAILQRTMESATERGVSRGMLDDGVLDEWSSVAARLRTVGGMEAPAAAAAMMSLTQRGVQAASLRGGEDLLMAQAVLQSLGPGATLLDAQEFMVANPQEAMRLAARQISAGGGDLTTQVNMFADMTGMNPLMARQTYQALLSDQPVPTEALSAGYTETGMAYPAALVKGLNRLANAFEGTQLTASRATALIGDYNSNVSRDAMEEAIYGEEQSAFEKLFGIRGGSLVLNEADRAEVNAENVILSLNRYVGGIGDPADIDAVGRSAAIMATMLTSGPEYQAKVMERAGFEGTFAEFVQQFDLDRNNGIGIEEMQALDDAIRALAESVDQSNQVFQDMILNSPWTNTGDN